MKRVLLVLIVAVVGGGQTPNSIIRKPPETPRLLTCADYKDLYERDQEMMRDLIRQSYRFSDLRVTTYPDRRTLRADELMNLLDFHRKELGIDSITLGRFGRNALPMNELLYPQYFDNFTLSRLDWKDLQDRARRLMKGGGGHPDVVAHWKAIAAGTPPFGLKVRE